MALLHLTENKPTVLAVGLFVPGSGFTRVFQSLFENLSDRYTIHWLGIGYKGETVQTNNYTLHPCNVNGGDIYGAYGAAKLAVQVGAKTVLLLNDFYLLKNYAQAWLPLKQNNIRLLAYVPLDGYITDASGMADCFFLDELVLYNKWAMQEVQAAIENYLEQHSGEKIKTPTLSYVYHGTDTLIFKPAKNFTEQRKLKQGLFKVPNAAESIFILNANRYNERKDIESTIEAFANALPQFTKPAYLCLHTPNIPPHLKERLLTAIKNSGCQQNILLNPLGEDYVNDTILIKLYQASAIGINTSNGEGWGMISFEHAACGAAQIVPGHTAPAEVWKGAGIIISNSKPVQLNSNPFLMYRVDTNELANQLVKLVNNETQLAQAAENCYSHSHDEQFNWHNIAAQWKKLL